MDIGSLGTHGFVRVPYPTVLRKTVLTAVESWERFCKLPDEGKLQLTGGDRIQDYGYMRRMDRGVYADDKELFHVDMTDMTSHLARSKTIPKEALLFINNARDLIEGIAPIIIEFALSIGQTYAIPNFADEVASAKNDWTFRFLHYFPHHDTTKPRANAHVDRGGFTLHLYESSEGGEYLTFDGLWKPWPISSNETILFPSMGLQYRSHNQLKALYHQVRRLDQDTDRYAVVAFIDFKLPVEFDTSKYRLQEFPVGFNYDIAFEQFVQYFKAA